MTYLQLEFLTGFQVEDLFYNVSTRRRAFSSSSEEYAKILDMAGRYAVHCSGVAFSCKKHGDSAMGISVPVMATTIDRIRLIHGPAVANELIELPVKEGSLGLDAICWASNVNYHVKRTTLLLFINHRAVESSAIKKALEHVYTAFLPKGGHPFVYLSIEIDPRRVDVNVHPTKREVNFLHEDEIIGTICDQLRIKLTSANTSRTFMTQSLLPGSRSSAAPGPPGSAADNMFEKRAPAQKIYENNLVRTDAKLRKITSMLHTTPSGLEENGLSEPQVNDAEYEQSDREPFVCRLTSVKELRAEVRDNVHNDLTEIFAGHSFVGVVDERRRIVAIQGGVKLFLVDYGMIWYVALISITYQRVAERRKQ